MKRILFPVVLMALLTGYSCSSEEDKSPKPPVCSITVPQDGAILDLYQDVIIKGTASDSDGKIIKVALAIDGKIVPEITEVPFEHKILAKDLKAGSMKISLAVADDGGNGANDEVTVTIQDQSEAPSCSITAPAHGSELNVYAPFKIEGAGEAISGEIKRVTLKINDNVIPEVTSLPIAYDVPAETYPVGNYTITLEVENSRGKIARDMVTITLSDLDIAPECSITEPADGSSYEKEDAIVIKGTGSDEDGTIAKAVLKVNDNAIASVTNVPFEYTLAEEYKEPGNVRIVLEVTDNNGKKTTDEITVVILGQFRQFTDTRDNKTYQTVKIADQVWFTENLAYLPQVSQPGQGSETEPHYYVYGYDGNDVAAAKATDSYKTRGVLYNWIAAGGNRDSKNDAVPSGVQGACPAGWHFPSEAEWAILYNYVRSRIPDDEAALAWDQMTWLKNISGHLRSKSGWPIATDPDFPLLSLGGLDTYGINIQLTGCRFPSGFYYGPGTPSGKSCTFWLPHYDAVTYPSSPGGVTTSMSNYMYEPDFGRGTAPERGYPVRCIQD